MKIRNKQERAFYLPEDSEIKLMEKELEDAPSCEVRFASAVNLEPELLEEKND